MAFLDNSGDIVLDAVLTDAGRKRMAEGKFNIAKYAFSDEEINYELFNNTHPSGSAFYDLQIMQTPILEAFTNNTSTMSSKLMTLSNNNFLYLPTFKLNEKWGDGEAQIGANINAQVPTRKFTSTCNSSSGTNVSHKGYFIVTCDADTEDLFKMFENAEGGGEKRFIEDFAAYPNGLILGFDSDVDPNRSFITVDQGIGGTQEGLSLLSQFPPELRETAFLIRIDHRYGRIAMNPASIRSHRADNETSRSTDLVTIGDPENSRLTGERSQKSFAFVDDDHIAAYYITNQDSDMVLLNIRDSYGLTPTAPNLRAAQDNATSNWFDRQSFQDGPVGSRLMFTIRVQDTLSASNDLFGSNTLSLAREKIDSEITGIQEGAGHAENDPVTNLVIEDKVDSTAGEITVKYIDSVVTVTGVTTGYTVDIPVRYVKKA